VTHGKPALLHEEVGFTATRISERVAAAVSGRATAISRSSPPAGSAIVGA